MMGSPLEEVLRAGESWSSILSFWTDPMWTPHDGKPTYLGELDPSHRENLWGYLLRNADKIRDLHGWSFAAAPDDVLNDWFRQCDNQTAAAWLLETRFMQALAALLIGDGRGAVVRHWEEVTNGHPPKRVPNPDIWE